jgi:hypothetical protein
MDPTDLVFAYMASQPSLPVTSVVVITVGLLLMFGRVTFRLVARWIQPTSIRRTRA